jgi:hypothetical protein
MLCLRQPAGHDVVWSHAMQLLQALAAVKAAVTTAAAAAAAAVLHQAVPIKSFTT